MAQPVPGCNSVYPGAKGPVWRQREPLDGAGSVGGCDSAVLPELMGPPQLPFSGTTEPAAAFYESPLYFSNLLTRRDIFTLHQSWTEDPARWNGRKQHRTGGLSARSRILCKPFCFGGICFILHMVSSKRWLQAVCLFPEKAMYFSTFLLEPSLSVFCHRVNDRVCLSPIPRSVI